MYGSPMRLRGIRFILTLFALSALCCYTKQPEIKTVSKASTFGLSAADSLYLYPLMSAVTRSLDGENEFEHVNATLSRIKKYSEARHCVDGMMFYYSKKIYVNGCLLPNFKIAESLADSMVDYAAGKSEACQFLAAYCLAAARLGNNNKQDSAIYYFIQAEKIVTAHPGLQRSGTLCGALYSNIAVLYADQHNYIMAKNYYHKGLLIAEREKGLNLVTAQSGIANMLLKLGDTLAAYPYLQRNIAVSRKLVNNTMLCCAYESMGNYFYFTRSYDSAAWYLTRSYTMGRQLDISVPEGTYLARMALRKQDLDSAGFWLDWCKGLRAGSFHTKDQDLEYLETLSEFRKADGKIRGAISAMRQALDFQKEVIRQEHDEQFLTYEKEQTRWKAAKVMAFKTARLKLQKMLTKAATAGGIFLSLATGLLLWTKYKKQAVLMKTKNLKLQLDAIFGQINPGFIMKAVTPLRRMIRQGDDLQTLEYIANLARLMRHMLQRQRTGEVTLAFEQNFLRSYLHVQQQRSSTNLNFEINMTDELDPKVHLIPSLLIYPVVEYITEQGLAAGQAARIIIDLYPKEEYLEVRVLHFGTQLPRYVAKINGEHALDILGQRIALYKKQYKYISLNIAANEANNRGCITLLVPLLRQEQFELMSV